MEAAREPKDHLDGPVQERESKRGTLGSLRNERDDGLRLVNENVLLKRIVQDNQYSNTKGGKLIRVLNK